MGKGKAICKSALELGGGYFSSQEDNPRLRGAVCAGLSWLGVFFSQPPVGISTLRIGGTEDLKINKKKWRSKPWSGLHILDLHKTSAATAECQLFSVHQGGTLGLPPFCPGFRAKMWLLSKRMEGMLWRETLNTGQTHITKYHITFKLPDSWSPMKQSLKKLKAINVQQSSQ